MDSNPVVVETAKSTDTGQAKSERGSLVYSRCVGWMEEALSVSSVLGISCGFLDDFQSILQGGDMIYTL